MTNHTTTDLTDTIEGMGMILTSLALSPLVLFLGMIAFLVGTALLARKVF